MDSLTKQSGYPKDVFFLGAGVSTLAGVPTFANFREKAKDIKNNLSNGELNRELFKRVLGCWEENFNECNIEEFYEAVEMRETLANPTDKEKQETVTTGDIENFIYATIKKSIDNDSHIYTYELFLKKASMGSVIITTNWDIILETSRQYHIENGWISYEFVQPHKTILPDIRIGEPKFRVIKLHGSLNWGFCKECGKIYYFNEKVDDTLPKGEVPCNNDKCKGKLARIIVPPKLSKLIKPENESDLLKSPYFQLRAIWSKASEYLKMCERLYFIGYSFPETDVQMKTFISNSLRENNNLKEVRIISNQKHGNSRIEFEERYLSIFSKFISHSKIDFYYKGFNEFCTELDEYYTRNPPQPMSEIS